MKWQVFQFLDLAYRLNKPYHATRWLFCMQNLSHPVRKTASSSLLICAPSIFQLFPWRFRHLGFRSDPETKVPNCVWPLQIYSIKLENKRYEKTSSNTAMCCSKRHHDLLILTLQVCATGWAQLLCCLERHGDGGMFLGHGEKGLRKTLKGTRKHKKMVYCNENIVHWNTIKIPRYPRYRKVKDDSR